MHISPDSVKLTLKILLALLGPTLLTLVADRYLRRNSEEKPR